MDGPFFAKGKNTKIVVKSAADEGHRRRALKPASTAMEITSRSMLYTHPIKRTTTCNCSYSHATLNHPPSRFYPSSSPHLSVFSGSNNFIGKSLRTRRLTAFNSPSRSDNDSPQELAVLLEVEG